MEIDKILKLADSGLTAVEIIDIIDKIAKQNDKEHNQARLLGIYKGILMCLLIRHQSKTIKP
jgi:hypothetical protein